MTDFHVQSRVEEREALIVRYLPLVKHAAGRLAMQLPAHIELDDLYGYGCFGLVEAAERFDPERGVKFSTYAYARIRGAMLDGLRRMDWAPASLRKKAKLLEQTYARIEQTTGRPAEDTEVAAALEMSLEEFHELVQSVSGGGIVSLDDALPGDDSEALTLMDVIADGGAADPLQEAELAARRQLLGEAIERLPEKERLVVALFYGEGLTAKEVAEVMGLSPSRISQLHAKAILRLRGRLARRRDDFR